MNETVLTVLITSVTGVLTALITAVATAYTQINVERIKARVHDRPDDQGVGLASEETSSEQVLTPGMAFRSVNWPITVLLTVAAVVIMATLLLLFLRPSFSNRLITRYDFEGTDDGWSRIACTELAPDETKKSEFPHDSFFPGSMRSEVTTNYALTGQSSLKVTTSINIAGDFKGFLRRKGTFMGYGATIYVMTPNLPNASIEYVNYAFPHTVGPVQMERKLFRGSGHLSQ